MKKLLVLLMLGFVLALATTTGSASAHRSGCHGAYSCPSDLHSYWWSGTAWNKTYGWRSGWYLCTSHPEQRRTSDVWLTNRAPYSAGIMYMCTRH